VPEGLEGVFGARRPYARGQAWPERVDEHIVQEPERWAQVASVLHSNGDAYDVGVAEGRLVGVRGRGGDRVNHGRLGPKDLYGWQAMQSPDRLTTPLVREDGELRAASCATSGRRPSASIRAASCSSRSTTRSA
jgi:ferredoxin-nitrate reductase